MTGLVYVSESNMKVGQRARPVPPEERRLLPTSTGSLAFPDAVKNTDCEGEELRGHWRGSGW